MAPTDKLYWSLMRERVMVDFRSLTDGYTTLAVLNLTERVTPPGVGRTGQPKWLFTHTNYRFRLKSGETETHRHPVIVLDDGHGKITAQLVLMNREAWDRVLRNSFIPPFEEAGRRIDFPRLPDRALPPA